MQNNNFFLGFSFDNDEHKMAEDRYEVFVNEDFLGYKTLKTQNEQITGIDSFLHNQGISNFSTQLDGDHYTIKADSPNTEIIKEALEVYFQNR